MATNHTPGPWIAEEIGTGLYDLLIHNELLGTHVARVARHEDQEANARLIAASPDLLAALEAILNGNYGLKDKHHLPALAAIAKARGE